MSKPITDREKQSLVKFAEQLRDLDKYQKQYLQKLAKAQPKGKK